MCAHVTCVLLTVSLSGRISGSTSLPREPRPWSSLIRLWICVIGLSVSSVTIYHKLSDLQQCVTSSPFPWVSHTGQFSWVFCAVLTAGIEGPTRARTLSSGQRNPSLVVAGPGSVSVLAAGHRGLWVQHVPESFPPRSQRALFLCCLPLARGSSAFPERAGVASGPPDDVFILGLTHLALPLRLPAAPGLLFGWVHREQGSWRWAILEFRLPPAWKTEPSPGGSFVPCHGSLSSRLSSSPVWLFLFLSTPLKASPPQRGAPWLPSLSSYPTSHFIFPPQYFFFLHNMNPNLCLLNWLIGLLVYCFFFSVEYSVNETRTFLCLIITPESS